MSNYIGRQRPGRGDRGHHPARAADQRRRGPEVPHLQQRQRRHQPDHRHLRPDPRPRPGRGGRPEPREHRAWAACPPRSSRRASPCSRAPATSCSAAAVYAEDGRYDTAVHQQLPRRLRARLAQAREGRGRRLHLRRAPLRHAAVARPGARGRAAASPPPTWWPRCASRTCRWRRGRWASSRRPPGQTFQISVRAVGRLSEPRGVRGHHRQAPRTAPLVRLKDVGRVELGAEDYASDLQFNGQDAVGIAHHPALQRQRAGGATARRIAELERLAQRFPPGHEVPRRLRHHGGGERVHPRRALHPGRGHRPRHPGHLRLPGGLAQHADPRRRPSRSR